MQKSDQYNGRFECQCNEIRITMLFDGQYASIIIMLEEENHQPKFTLFFFSSYIYVMFQFMSERTLLFYTDYM